MSELISKKQAATAFIDGEDVEFMDQTGQWRTILDNTVLKVFLDRTQFRIKPRTITINGIEVPAPFDAFNTGENELFWYLSHEHKTGYSYSMTNSFLGDPHLGAWRTKEEIKQVVAALRSVFGKK